MPHVIEQMLAYLFKVSAALALINMAPVFYFDGQAALEALLGLQGVRQHLCHGSERRLVLYKGTLYSACRFYARAAGQESHLLGGSSGSLF